MKELQEIEAKLKESYENISKYRNILDEIEKSYTINPLTMELDPENNLFIDDVIEYPRDTEKTKAELIIMKLPDFNYEAISVIY